jgi:biopolymer transport protein ExbD
VSKAYQKGAKGMYDWDEKPDLNITPLVDIMLVLLAILMVTTPAVNYEEKITLPKGTKSAESKALPDIEIRIDSKKIVYIKKNKYQFKDFADSFILYARGIKKGVPVYIRADRSLPYGEVMHILKSVKEAGFTKVALVTDG